MRHIFITLILLLSLSVGFSQSLTVIYNQTTDVSEMIKKTDNPETVRFIKEFAKKPKKFELISSKGVSFYKEFGSTQTDVVKQTKNHTQEVKTIVRKGGIYINHNTKVLVDQQDFMTRLFLIKENLIDYKWKITEEQIKIGDYICTKAFAKVGNEEVTAWFTPQIPTNTGPLSYYGLPGLIMKLQVRNLTIKAVKVTPTKQTLEIPEPTKGKKVSREEYNQIVEKKNKEMGLENGTTTKTTKTTL